jgi:titin
VPSASAAFQSVSPSPSVASADAAGTGASSTVAAVSTSATTIQLLWAPVQDASRYDVERSTVLPSWAPVGTTGAAETSFVDDSVSAGTTYYYRVVAFVAGQEPLQSDAVSATTPADLSTPPQFIVVTASATSVDLLWRDVEGELGYRIERSLDGTTGWIGIGTTGQDVTSFTDADLTPATTYSYRVIAVGTDAESPPSAVFTLATDADAPSESTKRDTSSAARRPTSTSASSTTAR